MSCTHIIRHNIYSVNMVLYTKKTQYFVEIVSFTTKYHKLQWLQDYYMLFCSKKTAAFWRRLVYA